MKTLTAQLGRLRIEYAISFVRLNNKRSTKVFKITEGFYAERSKSFCRSHSFHQMTTRKHYPGEHALTLIVNGNAIDPVKFNLKTN